MSDADRERWDARYAQGAYSERTYPSVYLETQIDALRTDGVLGTGKALDVACGAGRNSIYLAKQGFVVDAVDISAVALDRARHSADVAGVAVNWLCKDLETQSLPDSNYSVIVMFRYVATHLIPEFASRLIGGGHLIVEEHLQWHETVAGPTSARFRMPPGALSQTVQNTNLQVLHSFEGLIDEPDGNRAAVAQIVAQKS